MQAGMNVTVWQEEPVAFWWLATHCGAHAVCAATGGGLC